MDDLYTEGETLDGDGGDDVSANTALTVDFTYQLCLRLCVCMCACVFFLAYYIQLVCFP
jgi:hypothetical protein